MKNFLPHSTGSSLGSADEPWSYVNAIVVKKDGDDVAVLASPAFTGTPTAPTADPGTNTTQLATTGFVSAAISSATTSLGTVSGTLTSGKIIVGGGSSTVTASSSSIADLLARANHTGTQLASTISDFSTAADARVAANSDLVANTAARHTVNADTILDEGNANECTAADIRTHLDDATQHRLINDSSASTTTLYSGTKVESAATAAASAAALALIDDAGTSLTKVWSASKVSGEIGTLTSGIWTAELTRDTVASFIQNGGGITWTHNDGADTLTPALSGVLLADGSVAGTGRQELAILNLTDWESVLMSGGVAVITRSLVTLTSETGTADDLDTLTLGSAAVGDIVKLRAVSGHTITIKHGVDNIQCAGDADIELSGNEIAEAIKDTANWQVFKGSGSIAGFATTAGTLAQFAATTSAQLAGVVSDETGTGALVFATSPTLVAPVLGTPASGTLTNCTGLPTAGLLDDAVTADKLADTAVTPGSYILANITVDQQGRVTSAANGSAAIGYWEEWVPAIRMRSISGAGAAASPISGGTSTISNDAFAFDSTSQEEITFHCSPPEGWDAGTVKAKLYWSAANASTNGVVWGVRAVAYTDGESWNGASPFGTAQEVTDANTGNTYLNLTAATAAITIAGTPATGEMIVFNVYRDPTDAADTLAFDAYLIGVKIQWNITGSSSAW